MGLIALTAGRFYSTDRLLTFLVVTRELTILDLDQRFRVHPTWSWSWVIFFSDNRVKCTGSTLYSAGCV